MKLTWSQFAVSDRETIFTFISRDNVEAAIELDELFRDKAALLVEQPHMGRPGRVPDTREYVVHRHYVFVYDVQEERLRILRVLHTSLRYPSTKSRRPRKPK